MLASMTTKIRISYPSLFLHAYDFIGEPARCQFGNIFPVII